MIGGNFSPIEAKSGQNKGIMRQFIYKPNKDATNRTKNRFKEHTLVIDSSGEQPRTSNRVQSFPDVECILFESVERDTKHVNTPRWTGWIPASEVERTNRERKQAN